MSKLAEPSPSDKLHFEAGNMASQLGIGNDIAQTQKEKEDSPFKREFSRYKLDTFNVNERSLSDEFLHVLSIIHRQDELNLQQSNFVTWEVVEYWKDNVNPGFLDYRKSVSDEATEVEWRDGREAGGSKFFGIKNKVYIDCLGGYGIYNVGHRHPVVVSAVRAQLRKQALHSQELLDPLRSYCAHLLAKITPGELKYVFFGNSGTEAVEACLKMAMLATKRHHFVAVVGGFHGKSLGSLACTSKPVFRGPFLPALMQVRHVPRNDIDALESYMAAAHATGNPVAGVIMEPVLGEGGIYVLSDEYLRAARAICDEYGALLIFDEVQSGMGRTGKWFACEHAGVTPDLMALAKGLGGGVQPVGACIGTEAVWQAYIENPFIHTTTFGGNPLAMAAAIATMFVIHSENLCDAARTKGEKLLSSFRQFAKEFPDILAEARGRGLMLGLEFKTNDIGYTFARLMFKAGVLTAGTLINAKVIRIEPPLTISNDEIDTVLRTMRNVFEEMQEAMVEKKARQLKSKMARL